MGDNLALLDTSVLIEFFRKTDKRNSKFYQLTDAFDSFSISVITEYEIFVGATSKEQKGYWNEFLDKVTIIPLDSAVIQMAVTLNEDLKRKRNLIETADLFIAATAMVNNIPLTTLNIKHFDRIEKLNLVV